MAGTKRVTPSRAKKSAPIRVKRPTFIGISRSVSAEQKAIFHNVLGAGRSHVKRVFLDLTEEDLMACRDGLEQLIAARLNLSRSA